MNKTNDMNPKIKSIEVSRYDYTLKGIGAEKVEMKGYKSQYIEYDEKGNEILEINYTQAGDIQDKSERNFDSNNRLTEVKYYDEGDVLAEHKSFEYSNGKIKKEFLHYFDGSKDTISYIYDERGFLIEKITRDEDGYEEKRENFEKDDKDRLLKHQVYEEGELVKDDELIRNEKGEVTEAIQADPQMDEKLRSLHIYENEKRTATKRYDKEGNLIERFEYRYEGDNLSLMIHEVPGEKNMTQFEYDEKSQLILQEEYSKENELLNRVERKYDEHGNIIETGTYINMQGRGMDRDYVLKYKYAFY